MFVGMDYKYWRKHLDSELQKFPEANEENIFLILNIV